MTMASVLKHSEGVAYGLPKLPTVRVLKIITRRVSKNCSRCSAGPAKSTTPPRFPAMVASSGCEVDFEGTAEVAERFGLMF
jgi:hypothetical protein